MATPTHKTRGFRWAAVMAAVAVGVVFAIAGAAFASSVDESIVDTTSPTGSVTLAPGGSAPISIKFTVTGRQDNPATIHAYTTWTLDGSTFTGSDATTVSVHARAATDSADVYTVGGTVQVAAGHADGGPFTLAVKPFQIDTTAPAALTAGASSNYSVTVETPAPTNTAPSISVTGVTDGASYEIGSVPAAGCSVVDAEDGNSTFAATLTAISGPLSTYGLGSQTATCSYTDGGGLSDSDSATYTIIDTTDPVITFVSRTPAPNVDGWNSGDVTVNWSCSDTGGSGVVSATASDTVSSEGANQAASGTCTDHAGNTASDSVNGINIDKTPPTVAYTSASPAPNGAGWNNTDVVATFTATDTLSGFAGPSTTETGTSTTSGEGSSVTVGSPAFTDLAGNAAAAGTATSDPFKIDKTRPTVAVTGVSNGATYTLGSVPAAGCSTTDTGGSGVATSAAVNVTGGTGNGVGTFTATCSGAVDVAGNGQAAPVSVTYTVYYGGLSGILQPINPDNTSVFSRGKAVPVKFQLGGDEPTGFDVGGWKLQRQAVSCSIDSDTGTIMEAVVENPSNGFRYDATADQYIYNANFKDQAVGTCWRVVVTLDSSQPLYSAVFKLQK